MNEPSLEKLINNHLDINLYHNKDVVVATASLFHFFKDDFVSRPAGETFYKLPYKEISLLVFQHQNQATPSSAFQSFTETVYEELLKLCEGIEDPHLKECYEKFTHHITLALIQKQFILHAAETANDIAGGARNIANIAKETASKAQFISEKAEKLAVEADEQAKSTISNYISILGIFASIIITIFGGMQIISATSKLLQTNISLITLVFVLALLTLLIVIILGVLLSWISDIKNNNKDHSAISYAVIFLTSVLAISSLYLYSTEKLPKTTARVLEEDKS